jgi:hypothetical protein
MIKRREFLSDACVTMLHVPLTNLACSPKSGGCNGVSSCISCRRFPKCLRRVHHVSHYARYAGTMTSRSARASASSTSPKGESKRPRF